MNVRKLIGKGFMGIGLLLMLIGTVYVPSTTWAGALPAACNGGVCNRCGTGSIQGDGSVKCTRMVNGVPEAPTCNKLGRYCDGCDGGCDGSLVNQDPVCSCILK